MYYKSYDTVVLIMAKTNERELGMGKKNSLAFRKSRFGLD